MLALPIHTHGNLLAIDDDTARDRVYVALARPRVVKRADRRPRIRLVRWAAPSGSASGLPSVGGRLTLDIELRPSEAEIEAGGLGNRTALPVPWIGARVRIDGPEFEPVEAEVSIAAGGVAAVSVDLSRVAAGIMASLLEGDAVSPLQVTWSGHVLVRLPAVEVIATADVDEIRRRLEISRGAHQLIVTRSIVEANVRIEIRGANNPALESALREWVLGELTSRLEENRPLTIRAAASDVVRWPIQLATTLDDFVSSASREGLVETVILDPSGLGTIPPLEIRVLGDFTGQLERVDVKLEPLSGGEAADLVLTDDTPRSVRLGTSEFRWKHRSKLDGRAAGSWSEWQEVRGISSLLVPVPSASVLSIEVLAAGLDFRSRWASVRVVLEHELPGLPPESGIVELDASHASATWTRPLDGLRGRVRATLTFLSRRGRSIERIIEEVVNDQVIVLDPLDSYRVTLALVPAGTGWQDVALVMVDLRYTDGSYVLDETLELRRLDDYQEWEAPARPDGPRSIQRRLHTSFVDGRFQSTDWQTTTTGVLVVRIDGEPRRKVQLLPIYFDPVATRKATVRLRSGSQTELVEITSRTQQTVTLGPGPFSWTIAWTLADGTTLPESTPENGDDVVVLPRFRAG